MQSRETATETFHNPILSGFYPDPSICRVGDDYYMATSSFNYYPGIPIFHSRDLVHWEQIGHGIHRPDQLDYKHCEASLGLWAPTIRYHEGTFYLINTFVYSKGDTYYRAKNKEGYSLSLAYEGFNIMSISISSPSEASDGDKSINIVTTETTTKSKKDGKADSGNKVGLRKNFKEAMDSYEAFIDEYVAFMEKYKDSDGTDPSMLTDYAKYVSKYAEMAENFSKWEDENMNAAETAYYIEVQARVSKKLIAIT